MSKELAQQIQNIAKNAKKVFEKIEETYATKEELDNLPSSGVDEELKADVEQLQTDTKQLQNEVKNVKNTLDNITVDQTYNPKSENAQSGKAVAEAIAGVDGTYELIETIELAEEGISTITRNTEPNGKAYSFKDIIVVMKWGFCSANFALIVEPYWGGTTEKDKLRVFRGFVTPTASTGIVSLVKIKSDGNFKQVYMSIPNTNLGYVSANDDLMTCNAHLITDKNLTQLTLSTTSESGFPTGTIVEIWGVRA